MKILAAMSGGVDSTLAAALLLEQGHEVAGATMRLIKGLDEEEFYAGSCCSLRDVDDEKAACAMLGIPFQVCHFEKEFEEWVIDPFVSAYRNGRTPNPCIECNRHLKFSFFLQRALELGFDAIATGHYAKVFLDEKTGLRKLSKGADPLKDPSYVLYMLTQEMLPKIHFPLGGMRKEEVRQRAAALGLVNAAKKESQDICFVPDGDYGKFILDYTGKPEVPGDFVDLQGQVLGTHKGQSHYTIGQRKGLGLALGEPGYVVSRDMEANTITIGANEDLMKSSLLAGDFNWIGEPPPAGEVFPCLAKARYRQKEVPAKALRKTDGTVQVTFDNKIRAVTPGQAVVLYQEEEVLGGGTILEGGF